MLTKRKLIKNWTPTIPPLAGRIRFADKGQRKWNMERDRWLRKYYHKCEDSRLALALNCDEADIILRSRKMHLSKSPAMQKWLRGERTMDSAAPPGFHWETDEEWQAREKAQCEQEVKWIQRFARGFDFCSHQEREEISERLIGIWFQFNEKYNE